jgi:hypothetical protein
MLTLVRRVRHLVIRLVWFQVCQEARVVRDINPLPFTGWVSGLSPWGTARPVELDVSTHGCLDRPRRGVRWPV